MSFKSISGYFVKNTGNLMYDKANQLFFMLIIMTAFYSVALSYVGFELEYTDSALVNLSLLLGAGIALILLKLGHARFAKILLILHANAIIASSCVLFSPNTFVVAFFFPISICAMVILPGKDKKIGYALTFITLLLLSSMLLGDYETGRPNMPYEELRLQWLINSMGAVTLTFLITLFILNVNNSIQLELSNKSENASLKNLTLTSNIQTKNRLFSIISHDLRNPLITIRGAFSLLNSDDVPEDKKKFLINELGKRVDTTMVLMDNLLMWSRTQLNGIVFQPEILDPARLIKGVIKQLEPQAEEKKISIKLQYHETNMVLVDSNMFELIIRNLISNAIKFTNPEGFVKILIEKNQQKVLIRVSDSGVGMTAEMLEKLHNKEFVSTPGTKKEKGTGLGLVLCQEFVGKHQGEMLIESQPQLGTVISLFFDSVEEF
jgi:signal transduction histidine kinase